MSILVKRLARSLNLLKHCCWTEPFPARMWPRADPSHHNHSSSPSLPCIVLMHGSSAGLSMLGFLTPVLPAPLVAMCASPFCCR
jgi:hypothetical protein